MRGMHQLVGLAGMALCVAAVAPATAGAAQTIGQTGLDNGACTNRVFVQHDLAAGPGYSPTSSGVITSWSAQANSATGQTLQLVVIRQGSGLAYTILHRDTVRTLANLNALNTFAGLQLPIEAGQLIAVYEPPGSAADCEIDASSGDKVAYSELGDPSDNVPTGYFGFDSAFRVNAQAVVEPDADHDGFGDETQDGCPTNPALHFGCGVKGPPPFSNRKKCKHKKKHKSGALIAKKCKKRHHH